MASDARTVREQVEDLVIVPDRMRIFDRRLEAVDRWSGVLQSTLADNECRHGRLPGDRTPSCGCWPQEQGATADPARPQRGVARN